jgi:charged multivesicular body protein 7
VHLARDKQAIRYNSEVIKFKLDHERVPEPITKEDEALVKLRDALDSVNARIEPLVEKITLAEAAAREAVAAKTMVRAKAALRSKKVAEKALEHHTGLAISLESTMHDLCTAADQVGIVEAMRLGADAMKALNEKMGGAEGVQGVVDAVNEQMEMTDEISGLIGANAQPMDDAEIDDEFAELEKAEKAKKEKATAAKLASLAPADQKLSEKQMEERRREASERMKKDAAELEKASESFSKMSFLKRLEDDDDEMEDADEERVPVPA